MQKLIILKIEEKIFYLLALKSNQFNIKQTSAIEQNE